LLDLQNLLFDCNLYFPLCLVSAPKLRIYINSCIKTIQLYYEVDFVINAALNSDWVRISLCVSLGSHRYGTLEGNLAYVPVMDPGFGSWHPEYDHLLSEIFLGNFWKISNLFQNGTRNIKKNPLISWDWIWKGRLCMDCVYLICRHDAARCETPCDWLYSVHRKIVFTDAMHLPGFCDLPNLLRVFWYCDSYCSCGLKKIIL
jgi:hypothetical protein